MVTAAVGAYLLHPMLEELGPVRVGEVIAIFFEWERKL